MSRLDLAGEEAAGILSKIEELAGGEMTVAKITGRQSSNRAILWQIMVVAGSIVIGGLLGFVITRSLSRPIRQGVALADDIALGDFSQRLNLARKDEIGQLANALDRMAANLEEKARLAEVIAEGDLTQEVQVASARDQLGNALKIMVKGLRDMVSGIQVAGEQIASGSSQVADASQSLSQGATESAASLEEVTASMNEMTSQVRNSAENAGSANRLSSTAQQAAEKRESADGRDACGHGRHRTVRPGHRQDHQGDRRNCFPDQSTGPECGRRGSSCRAAWQGLCRSRRRSPQSGGA